MSNHGRVPAGAVLCLVLGHASHAAAQDDSNLNLSLGRFDPSAAGDGYFSLSSPSVDGPFVLDVRLGGDWAHNPLVLRSSDGSRQPVSIVGNQAQAVFGVSVGIAHLVAFHVDLPVVLYQTGSTIPAQAGAVPIPEGAHVGDTRLGARVALGEFLDGAVKVAIAGSVWLPLGSSVTSGGAYTSDGRVRGLVQALVGGETPRFFWVANAGVELRKASTYLGVAQGSMVHFGAGGGVFFLEERPLRLGLEATAALQTERMTADNTNAELLAAARYRLPFGLELGVAGGPGLAFGIGTPDFRVVASMSYRASFGDPEASSPFAAGPETEPAVADVPPSPPPEPVVIAMAPPEPEPVMVASEPVASLTEERVEPVEPVPEPVPAPELTPPDPPDPPGAPEAQVVGDQIVLSEQVRFVSNSDVLLPVSTAILEKVRSVIAQLPADARFRIEGHTDDRGARRHNQNLSERRAAAVSRWLVQRGVAADRFETAGFGPDRPLASNARAKGRKVNRRVEIHILTPGSTP